MDEIAQRFRARMLRTATRRLTGTLHGPIRRRHCGTWDHHVRPARMFVTGIRQSRGGDGVARLRARERMRSDDPAEHLGLARGPLVRSTTLDAIRDRAFRKLLEDLDL